MNIEIHDLKRIYLELESTQFNFTTILKGNFDRYNIDTDLFRTALKVGNGMNEAQEGIKTMIWLQEQKEQTNGVE